MTFSLYKFFTTRHQITILIISYSGYNFLPFVSHFFILVTRSGVWIFVAEITHLEIEQVDKSVLGNSSFSWLSNSFGEVKGEANGV